MTRPPTTGPRTDAVVEDADFLARHGVPISDAAPRLGYKSAAVLERTLIRAGRCDIVSRLKRSRLAA